MIDRIEREVVLPVSPGEAWQALTDPNWLAEWLADEVTLDLRPGGDARFRLGERVRNGWVEEVSPPGSNDELDRGRGRLTFWWGEEHDPASRVELALFPAPDGRTRLRVIEARPLELVDLLGMPLPGPSGGRAGFGPALVAA